MKKISKHAKTNSNKINIKILIFQIISILIIIYCAYLIYNWYNENRLNNNILNCAKENVNVDTLVIDTDKYSILDVNFENLSKTNNEIIGWVYLENTNINYPIVESQDNKFYLNHSLDKSYNSAGWIFADYRCKPDFSSKNTTIYGHNRKDSSMFATLKKVINKDWYENNKYVTIATPEGNKIYKIFSVYKVKAETYYSTPDFETDQEYQDFLNTIKNRSVYDFNCPVSTIDNIISLSTCASNNAYRVVLHAKLITTIPNKNETITVEI